MHRAAFSDDTFYGMRAPPACQGCFTATTASWLKQSMLRGEDARKACLSWHLGNSYPASLPRSCSCKNVGTARLLAHLLQSVTHHVVSHLHKAPQPPQLCAPCSCQSKLELLSSVRVLLWKQQMLLCCMSICVLRLSQLNVAVLQQRTDLLQVSMRR